MFPVVHNNWLNNAFDDFFDTAWMPRVNATAPAVNVKENGKAFIMEMAVPGLKKEFCRVNIDEEGNLRVKIENKMEHKEESKKEEKHHYLRREFSYANYEQSYELPENVDKEHITAKVSDGVLTIEMPKLSPEDEKKALRTIEVG